VIDVSGPLDGRALRFMADSIERAADRGQEMALLQVNSRAVLDGAAYDRLLALVADPPLPVAVWVGPAPAYAFGAAVQLVETASHAAIAPGSWWGKVDPLILGESRQVIPGPLGEMRGEQWAGMEQQPAHWQLLLALDGREFHTSGGPVTVSTQVPAVDGFALKTVTFIKPDIADRFFRLAVLPEAAFFFLVVGLTVLAFEFYALGPGVAAAVAGFPLLLGGWGLSVLPTRWWALALAVAGWMMLTWAHQRGRSILGTTAGTVALFLGGVWLVDGGGQLDPRWWLVMLSVLAALFFYLLAMPTVQRARLSTTTFGREGLIGSKGTAVVDFDPSGVVEVDGARWRATAHREAGVRAGSEVVVTGVDGLFLEVDRSERETKGDHPANGS
jgi:membrane-bound serine protease (ClpP class)